MDVTLRFATPHSAGMLELDYERPALQGSEKQVAWAGDIRAAYELQAVSLIVTAGKLDGVTRNGGTARLPTDDNAPFLERARAALDLKAGPHALRDWFGALFEEPSARFWIEAQQDRTGLQDLVMARADKVKAGTLEGPGPA